MSSPYFPAKPGDTLLSKQWNELQVRLRDEIASHSHSGGDQGTKIAGDGIDPNTSLTVKNLGVTESLSIGNPVQLFVSATGNVGIGTTTPGAYKLQVSGALRADSLSADKVTTSALEGVSSFAVGAFKSESVETKRVTAEVVDGVKSLTASAIQAESAAVGALSAGSASGLQAVALGANGSIKFADNGQISSLDNNHRLLFRREENILELREHGSILLSAGATQGNQTGSVAVTPAGNVGIGTLTPGARLSIQQGKTAPGNLANNRVLFASGYIGDGKNNDGGLELRRDNLTQGIGLGFNTIYATGTDADQELSLVSRGASPLGLNNRAGGKVISGSIGIGVPPSSGELQFANTQRDKIMLWDGGAADRYGFGIANYNLSAFVPDAARFSVRSGSSSNGPERFVVTGAGDVGIGVSQPESSLHIEKNVAAGLGPELVLANKAGGKGATAAIAFGTDNTTVAKGAANAQIAVTNMDAATNRSEMVFATWDGAVSAEHLRLTSDGAVVTGDLSVTGVASWGRLDTRTEVRADAGLQGSAGARSGFFETSGPVNFPQGAQSFWHLLDVRHSNPANNYAMQLAGSFYDQNLWFRKTNNNPAQPWLRLLSTADLQAGMAFSGPITPKVGNNEASGIQFVSNPGGGGGDTAFIRYYVTSGETCRLVIGIQNDGDDALVLNQAGVDRVVIANGQLTIDPGTNLWAGGKLLSASDERLKRDIAPLESALEKVLRVRGVRFQWAEPSRSAEGPEIGVVAQDVEAVFPEAVHANSDGYKGVDYARLVAPLIEAIREQQAQIEALRAEVRALKSAQSPALGDR
jgi:hypothetical protein